MSMMVLPSIQETDLLTNSSFSVSGKTLMELFFDRILAVLRYILPIFGIIKNAHLGISWAFSSN